MYEVPTQIDFKYAEIVLRNRVQLRPSAESIAVACNSSLERPEQKKLKKKKSTPLEYVSLVDSYVVYPICDTLLSIYIPKKGKFVEDCDLLKI